MQVKSNIACDEAVLEKAKLTRDRLVEAVKFKRKDGITKCLVAMYTLPLSKELIAATCLGGLLADNTIWRMVDGQLEAKVLKLEKLWRRACKSQTCSGLVADSPWPSKTAGDVVDVVDRWQTTLMETLELSNAILVREAAIQMTYRRLEIEADFALMPIGESWGCHLALACAVSGR